MAERRRTTSVRHADESGRRSRAAEYDEHAAEDDERSAEYDERGAEGRRRPAARDDSSLSVKDVAGAALEQLVELTAKPAESIIRVKRTRDGWSVGIEVVEDRRIPSSADIMATYQADLDDDGDLVSYHRVRRYLRGSGNDSEDS